VVAVPSDHGDMSEDDIAVFVVADNSSVSGGDVVAYAKEHLPRYMVPRYVRTIDALPKTPTGKVQRFRLRGRAHAAMSPRAVPQDS